MPRLDNKKVLVNGCSFSRGSDSWPYHLQKLFNFDLVNLAQSGAGNTYIHESTIEELSKRSYDYVIIMWSGLSRVDFKVEDPLTFWDSKYTSRYQKTRNDWSGKVIYPVNDQDYVDGSWAFGCGAINNEAVMTKSNLFNGIYTHIGEHQFAYHSLIKFISLQNFLKVQNIPYVFTFFNECQNDLQLHESLYRMLDQTNIYVEENIFTMANTLHDLDETNHPKSLTHSKWANLLKEFIDAKTR
jgi:hypothetical protein